MARTPAQPSHTSLAKAQPEKPGVICDVRACARGRWGHAVRKRRPDTQSKARLLWQWGGVGERLPLNPDARYRERAIGRAGGTSEQWQEQRARGGGIRGLEGRPGIGAGRGLRLEGTNPGASRARATKWTFSCDTTRSES